MRLVATSLIGLLVATPLLAQEPVREREHVVREGDTLWDLADFYLDNPWGWPTIYQANTDVVEDPHWIYPQEVLVIPGLADRRRPPPTTPATTTRPLDRPTRTVFYREPVQTEAGHTIVTDEGMATVPVKPGEFHAAEFLASPAGLNIVGRMIRSQRAVERAGREVRGSSHPNDVLFLGYAGAPRPNVGDRLMMVQVEDRVRGSARAARMIRPTAILRVVNLGAEVIEAQIEEQFHTVRRGQVAVPLEMYPDFVVEEAEPVEGGDLDGRIIEFVHDQPLYGSTDRGFIDLGARAGVSVGDIFMAYLPERAARGRDLGEFRRIERLPPEAVAELRIVRVRDDHATFVVDNVVLPVLDEGVRVRRVGRMP